MLGGFSLMVGKDWWEFFQANASAAQISEGKSNCALAAVVVHAAVSITMMIAVGRVMASGYTVATVLGDAMGIYIILQLDDMVKDFINATVLPVKAAPGRRLSESKGTERSNVETDVVTVAWITGAPLVAFMVGLCSWMICLAS